MIDRVCISVTTTNSNKMILSVTNQTPSIHMQRKGWTGAVYSYQARPVSSCATFCAVTHSSAALKA